MVLNSDPINEDVGTLFLRLGAGGTMLWQHGWPKLMAFGDRMDDFPDPLGIGSTISLVLVVFAEAICAALVTLGLWTRAAVIPLIATMAVAYFVVHGDEPFAEKELAAVYLLMYIALLFTGSGRFAIDRISFS